MERSTGGPVPTPAGPATPSRGAPRPTPREGVLWSALAVLSLLAGLATGTLQTWHHNRSLGTTPMPGGLRTPSPGGEDSTEPPLATAWSQLYGDNVTAEVEDLLLRAERSPLAPARAKKASRKLGRGGRGRNCHIRSLMVKVRDLGLGFNSDEIVLFKYCSGSCHRARSNYDLTLASLLQQQVIVPGPQDRIVSHPCCRPTRYEAVSFMDVQNTWQMVEKLSAAECSCIG
ncbi:PREDICTED: artemin [Gavialis gangeticus]|uniref:artemin n=1 Tax=Gavialis gangeticus TaxID=94835 RepID=UPI00092E70E6|nr:PREDICTED: artemin [Gavialis gangeticus]